VVVVEAEKEMLEEFGRSGNDAEKEEELEEEELEIEEQVWQCWWKNPINIKKLDFAWVIRNRPREIII